MLASLTAQGRLLGHQERHLQDLTTQVSQLVARPTQPQHIPVQHAAVSSLIALPDKFAGDPALFCVFLLQCHLYFTAQGDINICHKIAQLISLFTGKALTWMTTVWERGGESTS